jgi:hypothetical protein
MGAAGVEKGDERGSPHYHCQLHGVSHGHAGHVLQRKTGGFLVSLGSVVVVGVNELHTVDEEDPLAKPVMATTIFLITVKA